MREKVTGQQAAGEMTNVETMRSLLGRANPRVTRAADCCDRREPSLKQWKRTLKRQQEWHRGTDNSHKDVPEARARERDAIARWAEREIT